MIHRWYAFPVIALLLFTTILTACGGSKATDTPNAVAPTTTPTTAAPTTAAASVTTAPGPTGSAAAGSSVTATTVPTGAAGSASAAAVTRPASSATTGSTTVSTTAAGSGSAVTGTRPVGSVIASGTTTAGSAAAGTGLTVFTDPKGRFSFSRPSAWTVGQPTSPDSLSVVMYTTANPSGSVDISTEAFSGTITQFLDGTLAEIKKGIPDAQQIGTTQLQLDTEPAVQIDYTGTANGVTIYFSQIFALHKGTAYVLTLGTQPADIEKMKQQAIVVVTSWKFLQ